MAAKRSKTIEQIIQEDMPGWKVVTKPARAARRAAGTSSTPLADAVSPGLAAQQAKYQGKAAKRKKVRKVEHAKFVTVTPESQPDSAARFHKTVLVKGNKVIAERG